MKRIDILATTDVPPGEVRRVALDSLPAIAIYNLDGEFFATDDICSHGEASLADGDIEDGQIICPFHSGAFDIRTGEATASPCWVPLKTHQLAVENDRIFLMLEE